MLHRALLRALLAVLGVVLGLVLLEAGLQTAALLRPPARLTAPGEGRGGLRVLCIGDSHTYGIWVDPHDTYPARLRRTLGRTNPTVEVLNAGVPGMNSSQVRDLMPELLQRFRPDVVLVMVGVADFWNLESLRAEHYRGWRWVLGSGAGLFDRSRVVKLLRLLRFNLEHGREPLPAGEPLIEHTPYNWQIRGGGPDIDVDIDMHFDDGLQDIVVFRRLLQHNLAVIAAAAEAQRVPLILMTYPTDQGLYAAVNEVYRQFAGRSQLRLIDLGAGLAVWQQPPFAAIAFFPDFHPRRAGYEIAARLIATELESGEAKPPR